MRRLGRICPILILGLWLLGTLQVGAVYEGIPNVSMSVDGNAFTTHAKDIAGEWYEKGTEIFTGVTGDLREPGEGEHLYPKICEEIVPVEKWVVSWEGARCAHKIYPSGNMVYGESFGRKNCMKSYYSGWFAYCADCKEPVISNYVYMSRETARKFTYMDLSVSYFYKCPHCDNLEQALTFPKHICKDISANRYFVRYHANKGEGHMEKSVHMVNNVTIYEGQEVTPQTTLNLNTYTRNGYEFAGWNTVQDGSGESYTDGAEIWNLSMEQNANVVLYAQWRKCESVLELDPAGGSYAGEPEIISLKGKYSEIFFLDLDKLTAPIGNTVHFDTQGGEAVPDCVGSKQFVEWSCSHPFHGKLEDNCYTYQGPDGGVDRMTAIYTDMAIILPDARREGYSFGGWYADEKCTIPIGVSGDKYIPTGEITLYAGWVDLLLTAEDNYTANQGKGAVDLTWKQPDDLDKVYLLYQRTDETDWIQIGETLESGQGFQVAKNISFSGAAGSYVVPYSGFYTLTLSGAQGDNFGEHQGGLGGQVEAVLYLERGERLRYVIGGQNGYSGGGQGKSYANGGGYSLVSSESRGTLLIAGGGGGASDCGDGGAGGSGQRVIDSEAGQDGEAGGGGGYRGGIAGKAEIHEHVADCKHVHIGTSTTYGGCYTKEAVCGSTDISKQEAWRSFYYGNVADDGSHKVCERCASDSCAGHLDIFYRYTCRACDASSYGEFKRCTAVTAFEPACGQEEGYSCGMEAGQVLSAEPAYGGSNYINRAECITYAQKAGIQCGNGQLTILSKQVGVLEKNVLPGVTATDVAPPDAIEEATIVKTALSENEIRVAFGRPEDKGTAYYHMAESYDKGTNEHLCTSNQTKNVLTSGVTGYRYVVDTNAVTEVTTAHTYLAEEEEQPFLVVEISEEDRYLHVAAVDKAGNIGPSSHILISSRDVIYWPLLTEQLQIEAGSHVYPAAGVNTYYVKADGSTPFAVLLEGLLCGTAREDYQINRGCFQTPGGILSIIIPNRDSVTAGTYTYSMSKLQKMQVGTMDLQDASYTMAKRYNRCRSLEVVQRFVLAKEYHGQQFQVTPRVAAFDETEVVWSQEDADLQNSIYLIADGKGPDITGLEILENAETLDLQEGEELSVNICATDSGSGLAALYAEVRNLENGMIVRYTDDILSGQIAFEISLENEVFQGSFAIGVYAEDNVGNETVVQNHLMNVGLSAHVTRVLAPHTPVFKKGESGVLHIETVGYIEKVQVTFPVPFAEQDATLNRTFIYENPAYLQTEEIPFIVPFCVPEGKMHILVRAYKAGTELEAEPELVTIRVKGSILDELRTRLR